MDLDFIMLLVKLHTKLSGTCIQQIFIEYLLFPFTLLVIGNRWKTESRLYVQVT